jgi:hypothetical protein
MAGIKLRSPGHLARDVAAIRDKWDFRGEFKFAETTQRSIMPYREIIDALVASDAHISATVVNKDVHDPFVGTPEWEAQAQVAKKLVVGSLNRRELACLVLDMVSTPVGIALDEELKRRINQQLRCTAVISSLCLDSRTTDLLQVADLVAGVLRYERNRVARPRTGDNAKAKVARYLIEAFQLQSADDVRSGRVNILTLDGRRAAADSALRALPGGQIA